MFRASLRRPAGHVIVCGDASFTADTAQCVHCGQHWEYKPGSGEMRGFCQRCMGMTCGGPNCRDCMPMEKRLDLYEKGKIRFL
jgi:hypothetical protein